jgi:carboxymethylenebutenolidase
MPETRHLQHHINSGYIRVVTDMHQQIPAFWAHPTVGREFPGLVLLHDDWGLGAAMRNIAHRFAEVGYYVIVPDLFDGNKAYNQIEADGLEIRYKTEALPKANSTLKALETHPKCNSKMAVLGWDLGAELAINLALERMDVMATVAFYGNPARFFGELNELHCPLLAIYAEQDEIPFEKVQQLEQELLTNDNRHQVTVYPNTSHGFYNHLTPAYAPAAAEDAWRELLDFLERYQGKPPAPTEAEPGRFNHGRIY